MNALEKILDRLFPPTEDGSYLDIDVAFAIEILNLVKKECSKAVKELEIDDRYDPNWRNGFSMCQGQAEKAIEKVE